MVKILDSIARHPAPSGAKKKVREHAEIRKEALEKMLSTPVGEKVFPDGKDLSRPAKSPYLEAHSVTKTIRKRKRSANAYKLDNDVKKNVRKDAVKTRTNICPFVGTNIGDSRIINYS